MQIRKIFRAVRPFISALSVIATAAALVFTIYFTQLGLQWTYVFGRGSCGSNTCGGNRVSRAEWVAMRRTTQLTAVKDKLDHEMHLRKRAEDEIVASKPRLHLIDEILPTMVAFVDIEGRCQYHNRAFMDWLRLRPEQIHGRHIA